MLLISARVLGEIALKLKQPAVIGEILAGVLLGPSLLGNIEVISPFVDLYRYPSVMLEAISLIGALMLLFITGYEIDLGLIKHHAKSASSTALGGLIIPLIGGYLISSIIPDKFLVNPSERFIFSLFIATAMSVSAIPVIAKVLIDLNLLRRDIGQITIAAGMIDDAVAWILLSFVLGLIQIGSITLSDSAYAVIKVLAFAVLGFLAGRILAKEFLQLIQDKVESRYKSITLIFSFIFLYASIAQMIHLEAVFGAFIAGIVFSQISSVPKEAIIRIESITFGVFAPIFFASAGLKVDIKALFNPELALLALALITVATISKIFGAYVGARLLAKVDHWTALSFGAGLNARGAIQIIIATIGLSFSVISPEIFSVIILMAVITSIISPVMLKYTLGKVIPKESELKRLEHEEITKDLLIKSINRVLLPVRRRPDYEKKMIEAKIIQRIASRKDISVTLLTVTDEQQKNESLNFLDNLSALFTASNLNKKIVVSDNPLNSILEEAKRSYDLIVIGATERTSHSLKIFNPLVDELLRLSPCRSLVIQASSFKENWQPKKILVPSNASLASKRAAELAFSLVNGENEEVIILTVIETKRDVYNLDIEGNVRERQKSFAMQSLLELKKLGESLGVNVSVFVEFGSDVENVILNKAVEYDIDLVIVGTDVRPAGESLYIGPRVERILNNCTCPVAVFNSQ
ncbi:cation:proton antiporter [Ignavibacterium album]|uniref:cation:proton antiporter domain-containing protein n=1 Tax=Ignavibacterium album TaxID=591197 RepID=UPI0026F26C13|nr:cation:proton antiporter [Ignavibacterium album]